MAMQCCNLAISVSSTRIISIDVGKGKAVCRIDDGIGGSQNLNLFVSELTGDFGVHVETRET